MKADGWRNAEGRWRNWSTGQGWWRRADQARKKAFGTRGGGDPRSAVGGRRSEVRPAFGAAPTHGSGRFGCESSAPPRPRAPRETDALAKACKIKPGRDLLTPFDHGIRQARMGWMRCPATSVRRKFRPWARKVRRSWLMPKRWRMVAWRSLTWTMSSAAW